MKERYNKKIEVHGLLTLPTDERDFSLAGFFDQINIDAIPQGNFRVSTPLKIKDQGNTDFCSAYAVTGVSEDQEAYYSSRSINSLRRSKLWGIRMSGEQISDQRVKAQ